MSTYNPALWSLLKADLAAIEPETGRGAPLEPIGHCPVCKAELKIYFGVRGQKFWCSHPVSGRCKHSLKRIAIGAGVEETKKMVRDWLGENKI